MSPERKQELLRIGRLELLTLVEKLEDENKELKLKIQNIKSDVEQSLILPGWFCYSCKVFNGEAKEKLEKCRHCGLDKLVSKAMAV